MFMVLLSQDTSDMRVHLMNAEQRQAAADPQTQAN